MANNNDNKKKLREGEKQRADRAVGFACVAGVLGFCVAGPAVAIVAAKAAAGAGAVDGMIGG